MQSPELQFRFMTENTLLFPSLFTCFCPCHIFDKCSRLHLTSIGSLHNAPKKGTQTSPLLLPLKAELSWGDSCFHTCRSWAEERDELLQLCSHINPFWMNLVMGDIAGEQRVFLVNFCRRGIPVQLIYLNQVQETIYEQVVIFLGATWHRISGELEDVLLLSECHKIVVL